MIIIDRIPDLPNEEWREIKGYTRYLVSNMGRVKSLKHTNARILHTFINNKGYERVCLSQFGQSRYWLVHILVADAFIENPDPERNTVIDHINNNTLDNRASNLQWLSFSENVRKGWHKNDNDV